MTTHVVIGATDGDTLLVAEITRLGRDVYTVFLPVGRCHQALAGAGRSVLIREATPEELRSQIAGR